MLSQAPYRRTIRKERSTIRAVFAGTLSLGELPPFAMTKRAVTEKVPLNLTEVILAQGSMFQTSLPFTQGVQQAALP